MLLDALQTYMDAVNGATRLTQRSATSMARNMLIQAGMEPAADMIHRLSEQLIAAQDAHYSMLRQMIQSEVSLTMERMGLASQLMGLHSGERPPVETPTAPVAAASETAEPLANVTALPRQTPAADADSGESPANAEPTAEKPDSAKTTSVQKAPARSTPGRTASATTAVPAAKKAPAKKAPAKKAPAKKATTRATASRTAATNTPARKATDDTTTDDKTSS